MKVVTISVAVLTVVISFTGASAQQEPKDTRIAVSKTKPGTLPRREACKKEAREQRFGTKFVERNRFMKECLARRDKPSLQPTPDQTEED